MAFAVSFRPDWPGLLLANWPAAPWGGGRHGRGKWTTWPGVKLALLGVLALFRRER